MKSGHERMGSSVKKQLEKRYQKDPFRNGLDAVNLIDHLYRYKHTNMLTIISRVT